MRYGILNQQSKWSGKIWNAIGDSITEKNGATSKNYHDYIKEEINCTINNYGVSGTGWRTPKSVGGSSAIYQRISGMAVNADLITVFAGTNDWSEVGIPMVLGSFGDTDPLASFYGAVDNVLSQLVTKYPTKTVAVFTPLQRSEAWYNLGHGTSTVTLEQISDAIIKVSNKYNVPVLDLYRLGNMYAQNATFRTVMMPDGLHPNDAGHQLLADKILSFINDL